MTEAHLTKLWSWVSLGCFAYVVGSVISIQGGVDIFGARFFADLEKDGREVLAYFAVLVGSALLCVALAIAILFACRHGLAWHERIPTVLLEGLNTASIEGRVYQLVVVTVLVLVPLYGIGRSLVVANEGLICEQARGAPPIAYQGGEWRLVDLPSKKDPDAQLRLTKSDASITECRSGVEVNWYTPWAFAGLPALAAGLFLVWLACLVRPKASRSRRRAEAASHTV